MGSSSDYVLQSKDRGREGKNHFFLACCHSHTFSQAVPHNKFRNQRGKTLERLERFATHDTLRICNNCKHTHILVLDGTECNVFQNSTPSLQFLSKKPLGASLWPNRFASHIYKQIYSIQYIVYLVHCIYYILQTIEYTVYSIVQSKQYLVWNVEYTVQSTQYKVQSIEYIYIQYSVVQCRVSYRIVQYCKVSYSMVKHSIVQIDRFNT